MTRVLQKAKSFDYDFVHLRAVDFMFCLLRNGIQDLVNYSDHELTPTQIHAYITKFYLYSVYWAVSETLTTGWNEFTAR